MKLASLNLNGYCNCTVSYRSISACTYWFNLLGGNVSIDEQKAMTISSEPNAQCGVWLSQGCDQMRLPAQTSHSHWSVLTPLLFAFVYVCVHKCSWSQCAQTKHACMWVCLRSPLVNVFTSSYSNPHKKQLGVPMEHLVSGSWPLTKSTLCLFPMI